MLSFKWKYAVVLLLAFIPVVVCLSEDTEPMCSVEEPQLTDNAVVMDAIRKVQRTQTVVKNTVIGINNDYSVHSHTNFYMVNVEQISSALGLSGGNPEDIQGVLNKLQELSEKVDRNHKAVMDEIAKVADKTVDRSLERTATSLKRTPAELEALGQKVVGSVADAIGWFDEYVKPVMWVFELTLAFFGGGNHSYPWALVGIIAMTSTVHWIVSMYQLSTSLLAAGCRMALFQASNAGITFFVSRCLDMNSGKPGHFVSCVCFFITWFLVHSSLGNAHVQARQTKATEEHTEELRKERMSRQNEVQALSVQNASCMSAVTSVNNRVKAIFQSVPQKVVTYLGQ